MSQEQPPEFGIPIIELGGTLHYSQELFCHLLSLPKKEVELVVQELEWRAVSTKNHRLAESLGQFNCLQK